MYSTLFSCGPNKGKLIIIGVLVKFQAFWDLRITDPSHRATFLMLFVPSAFSLLDTSFKQFIFSFKSNVGEGGKL